MKPKPNKEVRQFWIESLNEIEDIVHRDNSAVRYKAPEQIVHVIEYSAYQALLKRVEKAESNDSYNAKKIFLLEQSLDETKDALEIEKREYEMLRVGFNSLDEKLAESESDLTASLAREKILREQRNKMFSRLALSTDEDVDSLQRAFDAALQQISKEVISE